MPRTMFSNYDDWKLASPDDKHGDGYIGTCDVCGRRDVPLSRGWVTGIETFYCEECAEGTR